MITESGKGLHVLIQTEPDKNWETFATWYSIYKNWPEAKVVIVCSRNGTLPFESFQWTKRLKIPIVHRNPITEPELRIPDKLGCVKVAKDKGFLEKSSAILVIQPYMMAIDVLNIDLLKLLNESEEWADGDVWYLKNQDVEELIEDFYLSDWSGPTVTDSVWLEASECNSLSCLVNYKKGCGRWIDSSTGCPFSSAHALITDSMTVNELRVNELWRKMTPLFNSVV